MDLVRISAKVASPQEIRICNQVSRQTREIRKKAFNLRRSLGCTWNLKWQSSPLYSTYDTHDQHKCRYTVFATQNKIWRSLRGRRATTLTSTRVSHPVPRSWLSVSKCSLGHPWVYPCSNLLLLPSFPFMIPHQPRAPNLKSQTSTQRNEQKTWEKITYFHL